MKTTAYIIITICFLFLTTISCMAGDVRLAWDPNSEPELAGYMLYISEDGNEYFRLAKLPLDEIDPSAPEFLVTDLEDGQEYCFVATAYSDSFESDYSNEVCAINGEESFNPDEVDDGGGGGCFINTTFDRS